MDVSGRIHNYYLAVTHTQELMDKTYLACRYADQRTKQDWMLNGRLQKSGDKTKTNTNCAFLRGFFVFTQLVVLSLTPSMFETALVAICAFLWSPAVRRPPRFVEMANTTSFR